jgi:hypothetical protein
VLGDQTGGVMPVTVIWSAVVVTVPPTVQVRDSVAVRAPVVVGAAATSIVQVAFAPARSLVPQLSFASAKSPAFAPVNVGAEQLVAEAVPELVSVKLCAAEVVPTSWLPKPCVSGVQARLGDVPVTVIWSALVVTVPPTVQVRDSVAVRTPGVLGAAATSTVQVAPAPADRPWRTCCSPA